MSLIHSYNAMPLSIRTTISLFFSYTPRNKKDFTAVFEKRHFLDKEKGEALNCFKFDVPYAFLYVDVNTNSLYKKTIVLHKEIPPNKKKGKKGKTKGSK